MRLDGEFSLYQISRIRSHRPQKPSIDHVIVMFSDQLHFHDANFTVYGLFPINLTSIFGMFAGVFTYVIILIQFDTILAN
ncbi:7tm Chemosensory receptor [Popillia japonica]|uniref:7tm Chemosensory receptor n=1 Tax=Popillia japonica TaxID=7064 RepID=A0AAW1K1G1_POPJA